MSCESAEPQESLCPIYTNVGVVGSGLIGSSWAALLLAANCQPSTPEFPQPFRVTLMDVDPSRLEAAQLFVQQQVPLLRGQRFPDSAHKDVPVDDLLSLCRLSSTSSSNNVVDLTDGQQALRGAHVVLECLPEVRPLKQAFFHSLAALVELEDHALLCSSSSCVPISHTIQLVANQQRRSQCLVVHPFNPPLQLRLVEVVPHEDTRRPLVAACCSLLARLGQRPVVLGREVDGFAANRLQFALMDAAFQLVADGVLAPADVDTVVTESLGPRWAFCGPFRVMQVNGGLNGFADYERLYVPGMRRVLRDMGWPGDHLDEAGLAPVRQWLQGEHREREGEVLHWRDSGLKAVLDCKLAAERPRDG